MTYGSVSFLFMGDANADTETRIANSGTNLQADILKVGHHGSAKSSSSSFLSKVKPKISVIEVGAGNPYGHPTSATLGRLAQVGSAVYRTDQNGDVTVTTDGSTYDVTTGQLVSGSVNTVTTHQAVSLQSAAGAVCDCSSNRYNCKDFSGQGAAQACYDYCISLGKGDIHRLDGDKNSIVCEG